ncbi:MAG: hypothetical protein PHR92_16325 [Lachnospiraceae bacterium]|nr:hypothetical protein [Lachnospiraceae bacterium]
MRNEGKSEDGLGKEDSCIMCGAIIPGGRQVCMDCEDVKKNPLKTADTGNPYYDYLVHEVQVVCDCPADKAMAVVSYVNSLGSNPLAFIQSLPEYLGEPHPDADAVLRALENIRVNNGIPKFGVCFPEGYQNRASRRKAKKEERKREKEQLEKERRSMDRLL